MSRLNQKRSGFRSRFGQLIRSWRFPGGGPGRRKEKSTIETRHRDLAEQLDTEEGSQRWRDWRWQVRHAVRDIASFEELLGIRFEERRRGRLEATLRRFPLAITPYYLSLIDAEDYENDPIFLQSFPRTAELDILKGDMSDPLAEDRDSPVEGITHRYPDRVLFQVSNTCSMYCRHCTRKRRVGDRDFIPGRKVLRAGFDYIRAHPVVRDVLLSGGDPLMLSDDYLDWILTELDRIPHVEIVRIGTRMPVVLPYRVTEDLAAMLKRHHPLYVNTHFNHPREFTASSRKALARLADAGIPLGNQAVLLAGVNDCPRIMRRLVHNLVRNRVRPYYLYQCDMSEGLSHFRTPVGKGIEIIESLIGHTSGLAVPTYVIDAPGGGGKIPVMPQYLISWNTNKVILRNFEGVITTYKEPDSYRPVFCDRDCDNCRLSLKLEEAEEYKAVGIEQLLADHDAAFSLVPAGIPRIKRRAGNGGGPGGESGPAEK